jgi:hypothetical protein
MHREAIEHNKGVAAHEAKICAIIFKNSAFKKKPQNIQLILKPISPEA